MTEPSHAPGSPPSLADQAEARIAAPAAAEDHAAQDHDHEHDHAHAFDWPAGLRIAAGRSDRGCGLVRSAPGQLSGHFICQNQRTISFATDTDVAGCAYAATGCRDRRCSLSVQHASFFSEVTRQGVPLKTGMPQKGSRTRSSCRKFTFTPGYFRLVCIPLS